MPPKSLDGMAEQNTLLSCVLVCSEACQNGGICERRHRGIPLQPGWQFLLSGVESPSASGAPLHGDGS